jgi:hypothetical protein
LAETTIPDGIVYIGGDGSRTTDGTRTAAPDATSTLAAHTIQTPILPRISAPFVDQGLNSGVRIIDLQYTEGLAGILPWNTWTNARINHISGNYGAMTWNLLELGMTLEGAVRLGWGGFRTGAGVLVIGRPVPAVAKVARTAEDILRPGGYLIGNAGTSSKIRILQGSADDAAKLFDELAAGGRPRTGTTYPGRIVELPNGGVVKLRPSGTTGNFPTIDVDIPGIGIREIKFKP